MCHFLQILELPLQNPLNVDANENSIILNSMTYLLQTGHQYEAGSQMSYLPVNRGPSFHTNGLKFVGLTKGLLLDLQVMNV